MASYHEVSPAELAGYTVSSLPKVLEAYTKAIQPYDRAMLDAARVIDPQKAQHEYDLSARFSPLYNQLTNDLQDQNTEAGARRELNTLRGTGRDLVQEAVNLDELANPEFYATRRHSSALFNQLLDSVNPNGLTPTESAEIERGLARTGELPGSQSWKHAQTFGNALNAKKDRLASLLSMAPSMLSSKTQIDPFQVGTGRAGVSAAPVTNFNPSGYNNSSAIAGIGNQLAGQIGSQVQANQANALAQQNSNRQNALGWANVGIGGLNVLNKTFPGYSG